MTLTNDEAMDLNELHQYVLAHRDDVDAFYLYVDRSKAAGRIITIDPGQLGRNTGAKNSAGNL